VQQALLDLYEQVDLFDQPAQVADRTRDLRQRSEAELVSVHGELGRAEDAVERYLLAFEAGTLPATHCGEGLRTLGARIDQLRQRHAELTETLEHATAEPPTDEDLDRIRGLLRDTIQTGANRDRKTLLQALVHEVRVNGRDRIRPTFRVPADGSGRKVRTPFKIGGPGRDRTCDQGIMSPLQPVP
jgi:site-specific DNA recombinase